LIIFWNFALRYSQKLNLTVIHSSPWRGIYSDMAKLKNHFFVSIGFWLKIKTVSETGKVPTHEQMILQNCEIFVH
jgi:hypothetical protein